MIDAAYLILITALLTDSWLNNIGSLFSTDQNATNISLINTWKQTGHSEHIWHPSVSLIRADEWPIRICLVTQFNPWSTDTLTCCQLWFHDVAVTFRQVKVHVCQRYRVVLYLFLQMRQLNGGRTTLLTAFRVRWRDVMVNRISNYASSHANNALCCIDNLAVLVACLCDLFSVIRSTIQSFV